MMIYIFSLLFFAFIGWVIDSSYCSIINKKIVISGYYKNLPFCPIYGFGGLLILSLFTILRDFAPLVTILLTTSAIVLLEYVGGWFCDKVLKERLWDYSDMKYNLHGYINVLHSFFWLILVSLFFLLASPHVENIQNGLNLMQMAVSSYDIYLSTVFLTLAILFTLHTRNKRIEKYLLKIKDEFSIKEGAKS